MLQTRHRDEIPQPAQIHIHARRVSIRRKGIGAPASAGRSIEDMITVTGPTGGIGSHVVSALLNHDEPVRVVARTPAKLPPEVRERVEVIEGSHRDPEVIDRAMDGARALFWLASSDPAAANPYECYVGFTIPAAAAVVSHQVAHVVTVSALGRGTQRYTGLAAASQAMDDLLRSTGAQLRALTAPSLMDNLLRGVPALRSEGVVRDSAPADLRAPLVARRDIGAVAARLLLDDSWTGQDDLPVLGPQNLSYDDIVRILSEVLDRPVRYERTDVAADERALIGYGFTPGMARAMSAMVRAKHRGLDDADAPDRATTTPTTLRTWSRAGTQAVGRRGLSHQSPPTAVDR